MMSTCTFDSRCGTGACVGSLGQRQLAKQLTQPAAVPGGVSVPTGQAAQCAGYRRLADPYAADDRNTERSSIQRHTPGPAMIE